MAQDVQLADPPAAEQEPERGASLVAVALDAPPVRGVALVAHSAELPDGRRGVPWVPAGCLVVHSGASLGDPRDDWAVAACWVASPGDPLGDPWHDYLAVHLADDHC